MRFYRVSFRPPRGLESEGSLVCVVHGTCREAARDLARTVIAGLYQVAAEALQWAETDEDGTRYLDFLIRHPTYANVWV